MQVMAYAPFGAEGIIIRVEADIRRGIPGIDITGLAEGAVREARERVRVSFRNSGFPFPQDRILINLAPAGVRKDGASLDLPIALAVLGAAELAPLPSSRMLVMGELELSGKVRPVRGVLAALDAARKAGITECIVPEENAAEASILKGVECAAVESLGGAVQALGLRARTGRLPAAARRGVGGAGRSSFAGDFAEARGQARYKRALEIAAAGGHNLLVFGPPGAGKTMLARRLPSIMAPLTPEEAVEVTRLHSLAGRFDADFSGLMTRPPFRSPHHSASAEGILGGGRVVGPGEISLAHYGVLFLDEAPEFRKDVLQALREPLEDRVITLARAERQTRLPAEFQLILAANPCPCGRLGAFAGAENRGGAGGGGGICLCGPDEVYRYWRKFGGALLDRVDLRVAVAAPETEALTRDGDAEKSERVAERVRKAVEIQRERFGKMGIPARRNALIPAGSVKDCCPLSEGAQEALRKSAACFGFSGRACHGILRVGRTIADLCGSERIDAAHILEAVQHRRQGEDPFEVLHVNGGRRSPV